MLTVDVRVLRQARNGLKRFQTCNLRIGTFGATELDVGQRAKHHVHCASIVVSRSLCGGKARLASQYVC